MGHAPDWMRGSMKKTGAAPAKPGITSRPIFHGEQVAMLADGGMPFDYDNPGKVVGKYQTAEELKGYTGDDPIVKARLGMDKPVAAAPSVPPPGQAAQESVAEAKPVTDAKPTMKDLPKMPAGAFNSVRVR